MLIPGAVGNLEARLDEASTAPENGAVSSAILAHPHPQYGGSMYDGVLDVVASVLLDQGINCLRFNFRGVGNSDGQFAQGEGEVDDLIAAFDWLRSEQPEHNIILAGYSFGSSVVFRSLEKLPVDQAILIAPPIGMMNFSSTPTAGSILGFAGDQDDFVDLSAYRDLLGENGHVIAGADHFFSGRYGDLADTIRSTLG